MSKPENLMKRVSDLVKTGMSPMKALKKAEHEVAYPMHKAEDKPYVKKLHSGPAPKGFHQCKTGDKGCFHCDTCSAAPEDCPGHGEKPKK